MKIGWAKFTYYLMEGYTIMQTQANLSKQRHSAPLRESLRANSESFNFDLWATVVRQQMVAALQKRNLGK